MILPDEVPIADRRRLESLLVDLTALRHETVARSVQPPERQHTEQRATSTAIAQGIVDSKLLLTVSYC